MKNQIGKNISIFFISILLCALFLVPFVVGETRTVECITNSDCDTHQLCDTYLYECVDVAPGEVIMEISNGGAEQESKQNNLLTPSIIIGAAVIIGLIILGLILRGRKK